MTKPACPIPRGIPLPFGGLFLNRVAYPKIALLLQEESHFLAI
jgi:hypothetical protein